MARIFILEDNVYRIALFREKLYKDNTVTYCDDVENAKAILSKYTFDTLFFDHDLGGKEMVNSEDPNTGYQLAKWVAKQGKVYHQIIIHSCNPGGADNILSEIKNCAKKIDKIPFPVLITLL